MATRPATTSPTLLGQLVVHYQPVVDLRTGQVVAAEALVRLRDEAGDRLLPPGDWLPQAEIDGTIREVDRHVAETAVAQLGRWRATRPGRALSMGLNVSVNDLDDAALPDRIAALAARHGVPGDALVMEVTETCPSAPGRGHEQVLERLAALGCNITLDDFGTGFSSISHLQRFPVHGLKVDRSFTERLGHGDRTDQVTRGLVRLGRDLGLHVVAEGIETLEQLSLLREMGCPFGQGYLFSRPVDAARFEAMLDTAFPLAPGIPLPRAER